MLEFLLILCLLALMLPTASLSFILITHSVIGQSVPSLYFLSSLSLFLPPTTICNRHLKEFPSQITNPNTLIPSVVHKFSYCFVVTVYSSTWVSPGFQSSVFPCLLKQIIMLLLINSCRTKVSFYAQVWGRLN